MANSLNFIQIDKKSNQNSQNLCLSLREIRILTSSVISIFYAAIKPMSTFVVVFYWKLALVSVDQRGPCLPANANFRNVLMYLNEKLLTLCKSCSLFDLSVNIQNSPKSH